MRHAAAGASSRTDAEIFGEARHALDGDPAVPATVRLHVDDGVAILTGTVRLASERTAAENAVRAVAGIRRLVNEIGVAAMPNPEGFEPPETGS